MTKNLLASIPGCRQRRGGSNPTRESSLRGLFLVALAGLFATSSALADPALVDTDPPNDSTLTPFPIDISSNPSDGDLPSLPGADVTFKWNKGGKDNNSVTSFTLRVGTIFGAADVGEETVAAVNGTNDYSAQITGIPQNGGLPSPDNRIYVRLEWVDGGIRKQQDYLYLGNDPNPNPRVISPTPGSLLALQDVDGCKAPPQFVIRWALGPNMEEPDDWWFYFGTDSDDANFPDNANLINSGRLPSGARSFVVTNVPTNGNQVHATIWWDPKDDTNDNWQSIVVSYNTDTLPAITDPGPGGTLAGTEDDFTLSPNGLDVEFWWLYLGGTPGNDNFFNGGAQVGVGDGLILTANNLPVDGSTVHATLFWRLEGEDSTQWKCRQFTYKASEGPEIIAPIKSGDNKQTIPVDVAAAETTVTWKPNGIIATWTLRVIDELTGAELTKIENIDGGDGTANISRNISNHLIITDGRQIKLRLEYAVAGGLNEQGFTGFTECVYDSPKVPHLTAPSSFGKCFATFKGNDLTFSWADGNFPDILGWWLYIDDDDDFSVDDTTNELNDPLLYNSERMEPDVTSLTLTTRGTPRTGLLTDGAEIWVRLWYQIEITVTTDGTSQPGENDQDTEVVTRVWRFRDFKFTNPECPELTTPALGGTLNTPSQEFIINHRNETLDRLFITISSNAPSGGDAKNPTPQLADVANSGFLAGDTTNVTIGGLSPNGQIHYVTLWWLVDGDTVDNWQHRTFCYGAPGSGTPSLINNNKADDNFVPNNDGANDTDIRCLNVTNSLTLTWKTNGAQIESWWLYVSNNGDGGGIGKFNIYNSDFLDGSVLSQTFPISGFTDNKPPALHGRFFVRLWWVRQSPDVVPVWEFADYYLKNDGNAPTPGTGPQGPNNEDG